MAWGLDWLPLYIHRSSSTPADPFYALSPLVQLLYFTIPLYFYPFLIFLFIPSIPPFSTSPTPSYLLTFMKPRNRFQGTDSASLWQIGLWYRPDRIHRLAELITWNRFLGSLNVYKFGHCSPTSQSYLPCHVHICTYFYVSVHCMYPTTMIKIKINFPL